MEKEKAGLSGVSEHGPLAPQALSLLDLAERVARPNGDAGEWREDAVELAERVLMFTSSDAVEIIRGLRDVGLEKVQHVYAGSCPNVRGEGVETEHDRADPQDECPACEVLRRADALLDQPTLNGPHDRQEVLAKMGDVSDRSDTSSDGVVAFPDDVDTETLRELDAFRERLLHSTPFVRDQERIELDRHLLKVRAHVVADHLETQRLQAEGLRSGIHEGKRLFTDAQVANMLSLKPGWELAPQRVRDAARRMEPDPICGAQLRGLPLVTCLRKRGHVGEHCPADPGSCPVHDAEESDRSDTGR